MRNLVLFSLLVLLFCPAARVAAQSEAVIGLGLAMSTHDPTNSLGIGTAKAGPLLRLRLGEGLGPAVGFDWHGVGAEAVPGTEPVHVGKVSLKPIMGGIAYTRSLGRYALSASMVAGYAFASLDVNDQARPAFRDALGASFVSFDTKGSVAWRPQLALWYDAAPRVGLLASVAYLSTRPTLSVVSDGRAYSSRLRTASVVVTFGLVYGVF